MFAKFCFPFALLGFLAADAGPGRMSALSDPVEARFDHTATALLESKVLLAGGMRANGVVLASAEIYDAEAHRFVAAGNMAAKRDGATAVLLNDGRVLIAGGWDGSRSLASAEVFDPATGRFVSTGSMTAVRDHAEAVVLADGRVLVAGGDRVIDEEPVPTAELYDPKTGRFVSTGSMQVPRSYFKAVLLKDGRILLAGGLSTGHAVEASAEVYDPASGRFHVVGAMSTKRYKLGGAALADGKAMVIGGAEAYPSGPQHQSTEMFDPSTERFTAGPSLSQRRFKIHASVAALPNGNVLVAGGAEHPEMYLAKASRFEVVGGEQLGGFWFSTATLLNDGKILVVGGYGLNHADGAVKRASLYGQ
jgi:hypothetical protein